MLEKVFVPIAIGFVSAAVLGISGLFFRIFDPNLPKTKQVIKILFGIILALAVGILVYYFLVIPTLPPKLEATQAALIATATKIEAQVEGTQVAGTSTAIADATQTAARKQEILTQNALTQAAKVTQVAQAILENGRLCSYAASEKTLSQGESDRNSNLLLIFIGVVVTLVFLALTIQGRDERLKFIGFLSATVLLMAVTGYGIWLYARHPLSSFPGNLQESGYRQELLSQCNSRLAATVTSTLAITSQPAPGNETITPTMAVAASPSPGPSDTPKPAPAIIFNDLFENDQNNWRAQKDYYLVNVTNGFLNVQFKPKYPRGDFYLTCDACTLPTNSGNFVYEVVIGQSSDYQVEPGFIFTASQFDEKLVNGYGVRLAGNGTVTLEKLGMAGGAIFSQKNSNFAPVFGFQKLRIEVLNGKIKISVNDHLFTENDFTIDGDHAGPHFGIYAFINDRNIENSFKIDDIKISTNP